MAALNGFAHDYASARALFLQHCKRLHVPVSSYRHPRPGPAGDVWAEGQGDPLDPAVEAIRCDLMRFFYPQSALWRAMVAQRTKQVARMALAGLATLRP